MLRPLSWNEFHFLEELSEIGVSQLVGDMFYEVILGIEHKEVPHFKSKPYRDLEQYNQVSKAITNYFYQYDNEKYVRIFILHGTLGMYHV